MFTGIVEELGVVAQVEQRGAGARLRIESSTVVGDAEEGSSIAVNGVCLTAVDLRAGSFAADLAPETLARTNLGALRQGSIVNLERPLLATGRLSGHVVQGHVDGTGEFVGLEDIGEGNWWLRIRIPDDLDRYVVYKGSLAIDGISLTVADIKDRVVSVTIIPHTYEMTTLRGYRPGDRVNLECDVLAKYVEKMLAQTRPDQASVAGAVQPPSSE
ncbi:MAG TPA: riboflavin synthase [Bryobacteraceae bacterium]|nr:riboflavin synthase [Bryobacteraceae bacterium]